MKSKSPGFFVRESLVRHVMTIGGEMNERGWILKVEDGFRTLEMQGQLVPTGRKTLHELLKFGQSVGR